MPILVGLGPVARPDCAWKAKIKLAKPGSIHMRRGPPYLCPIRHAARDELHTGKKGNPKIVVIVMPDPGSLIPRDGGRDALGNGIFV